MSDPDEDKAEKELGELGIGTDSVSKKGGKKLTAQEKAYFGEGKPLGVGEGYEAIVPRESLYKYRHPAYLQYMPMREGAAREMVNVQADMHRPLYRDGAQYNHLNLDPQQIFTLQQIMAQAGLLTEPFTGKVWGPETAEAYAKVLAYANQNGLTARQALAELAGSGPGGAGNLRYKVNENGDLVPVSEGPDRPPFVAKTTDPKVLETVFRDAAMTRLGFGIAPAEAQMLAKSYNQMEVQRQKEEYDKEVTGGTVTMPPSPNDWINAELEATHPEDVEDYRGLQYLTDALSFLASPAWGVGGER